MSDPERTASHTPSAFFSDRADAERALNRLKAAGVPESALRLSEEPQATGSGFAVTAHGLSASQRDEFGRLLAGGAGANGSRDDAPADPAHAPREVQPGFADVRPGYIPEPTYSTAVDSSQHPEGVPEPRGRFESQLDNLPEGDGSRDADGGRTRVTIISPKES